MLPLSLVVFSSLCFVSIQALVPRNCAPNFDNVDVSVANGPIGWGTVGTKEGCIVIGTTFANSSNWIWEQSGGSYVAKLSSDPGLVVTVTDSSLLALAASSNDRRQQWSIQCQKDCNAISNLNDGDIVGGQCVIKSVADGRCISMVRPAESMLDILECNGSSEQMLDFIFGDVTKSTNAQLVTGSLNSQGESDGTSEELLRNSYIAIGLLSGVIVLLIIALTVLLLRGRFMKGRSMTRYSKIQSPELKPFDLRADSSQDNNRTEPHSESIPLATSRYSD